MTMLAPRAVHGFSLVEVLVAVLVLALGLLGLGAVFPMVVRQQRVATETTLGLSARNAVEQILSNNENFRRNGRGWGAIREYVIDTAAKEGDWVPIEVDRDTSNYVLAAATDDPDQSDVVLPLSQRLYPLPMSAQTEPRFVWDLAARVTDADDPKSPMLVAVFLRPIDPGIRPPINPANTEPYSLLTTILDPLNQLAGRDRRLPISVDKQGRPTLDGRKDRGGRYALPIVVEVDGPGLVPERDQLFVRTIITAGTDLTVATELLAAPGQHFLDRAGNLYTVTRVRQLGGGRVTIDFTPPIVDPDGDGKVDESEYNPIMFVPQTTAVEPLVLTIKP